MGGVKERRILCPTIIQQFWPTITNIKRLKQLPTLEKLQAHMFKKFHMTSNDCEKHVNCAVRDGLLITSNAEIVDQNEKEVTIYNAPETDIVRDGHDWYCFECHRPGKVIECSLCWRVYHLYCIRQDLGDDKQFVCAVCQALQNETERTIGQKVLSLNELNQLLSYTYLRLIEKGTELLNLSVNEEDDYKIKQLIYTKTDLSLINDKIKNNCYKKLAEFQSDCQNIVHCVSVLNGVESVIGSLSVQILQDCNYDLNEIRQCVDCSFMSNQKQDKFWFCKPCNPPHDLVYAKQKGFPFWPAKVIKVENGIYDVRFFGSYHERSFIEADCVKPINTSLTQLRVAKRTPPLNRALSELKKYQKILETKSNNESLTSPLKSLSMKRPRRRADGTRPRKKMAKMKEDLIQSDNSLESSVNSPSIPIVKSPRQRSLTKTYVKSPMRTRNRGLKNPSKSITDFESSPQPNKNPKKYKRRSPVKISSTIQTQEKSMSEFFNNTSDSVSTDAIQLDSVEPFPEKSVKAKPRTNRLLNGIANDIGNECSNSSYESDITNKTKTLKNGLNIDEDAGNSSLARSRPVRQSKPNSRYKSPEMEVKIPKRKFRQEKIVIKKEVIEPIEVTTPPVMQNKLNAFEFTEETPITPTIINSTKIKKRFQIKAKKKLQLIKCSTPLVKESIPELPAIDVSPTTITPMTQIKPKRGRPKGVTVKNKIHDKIDQELPNPPQNTPQTSPKPSLGKDLNTSGGCNCEAKHKKQMKKFKESLESEHKSELMKLKKDLEEVKKVKYRLQNQNSALLKEIEQLKNSSQNVDKQQLTTLEQKHRKEISFIKKKQWCVNCEAEAIYFCCWNTSYCSLDCQQSHWHTEHKRHCRRNKR